MNTKEIPEGWWLNVTVMANYEDTWIVGVLIKKKTTWFTEAVFTNFNTAEDAYLKGMEFINNYGK